MSLLKPFSKLPGLNTATVLVSGFHVGSHHLYGVARRQMTPLIDRTCQMSLCILQLVESEEQLQQPLADALVQEAAFTVNV